MTHLITIKKNTSISEINKNWLLPDTKSDVIFEVSKSSSFQLFAEGVALGFLKELKIRQSEIELRFHKLAVRISAKDIDSIRSVKSPNLEDLTGFNIPEILCGIFGMQLLFQASKISDALTDENGDPVQSGSRKRIGACIWSAIQRNNGLLGGGKRQYLFSRHDYRVPKVLRETDHSSFPSSHIFRRKVIPIIQGLAREEVEEQEKKDLIGSWLYHIAENAHEHGGVDVKSDDQVLEEYRGVLLEKLALTNLKTIKERKDISESVRSYLLDLWENHGLSQWSSITIATVMDGGVGIQNSIADSSSEDSLYRLKNAFCRGVTRHSVSSKKGDSGYGLFDSIRLTKKLKACVVISSGNLFSVNTFKDIDGDGLFLMNQSTELKKTVGTSFSLMWPSSLNAN